MAHEGHEHDDAHDHREGHDHHDGHAHDHEQARAQDRAEHAPRRADLPAGAARGKILFLDAPSGVAGDMTIAALVDLGVPLAVVTESVEALGLEGFHVHTGTRIRSGIVATSFDVHVDRPQPERTYREVRTLLDASALPTAVRARAHATFRKLAEAEATVHRAPLDEVHFHEVGAVDALVDIVGSAAALEHLGATEVLVSPLPMGRGFTRARHGTLPLPAPAVVSCLAGFMTYDGGVDFEFVTPTGAAIVAAQASRSVRWPSFTPERTGWGAGRADLADRPNLLRAVLGTPVAATTTPHGGAPTHVVLEANVDDATGELIANCLAALFQAGAVDAWAAPITMKKGRPAVTIGALAARANGDAVARALLVESTTLGVRQYEVSRTERPRRIVDVTTPYGVLPVKVAEGPFGPPQVKPEFDACLAAAARHGVPVREVLRAAIVAYGA